MVESRDPESPFLTPKMVLKHQVSAITAQKRPKTNPNQYINVFLPTIRTF